MPALEVYNVTQDWDSETISYNNQPEYDAAYIAKRSFSTAYDPGSYENPFPDGASFANIEIDLSALIPKLDKDAKYINLRLSATTTVSTFNVPLISVKGINTADAPKLVISVSPDAEFEVKSKRNQSFYKTSESLYYSNMKLLSKLHIIDENAYLPDDENELISRDEFLHYAVKLLNVEIPKSTSDIFKDISDSLYKDSINFAAEQGFISAGETFRPYDSITVNEATVILLNILGAKDIAVSSGGFPSGYTKIARRIDLYDDISLSGSEITFETAFQLLYNALTASRITEKYLESETEYSIDTDENILKDYFDACIVEDVVYANEYASISGGKNPSMVNTA